MGKLHLIMPMGGMGSRFSENGYEMPKPLIEIAGKPFLYWSTISISKFINIKDITFIVLQKHIKEYGINNVIMRYFPEARIVSIPKVLPGPVLTCLAGIKNIDDDFPILFNDCDHMFCSTIFNNEINSDNFDFDGALLTFLSQGKQFSYVEYGTDRNIIGTVEKDPVSDHAICGAYTFRNAELFSRLSKEYLKCCSYSEYFISGIYNVMCKNNFNVKDYLVDFHLPFGTPEEFEIAKYSKLFEQMSMIEKKV